MRTDAVCQYRDVHRRFMCLGVSFAHKEIAQMRRFSLMLAGLAVLAFAAEYKVIKTAKVGGAGGFDYVYADSAGRKLYVPRSGNPGRVMVYNLDTLAQEGEIPDAKG